MAPAAHALLGASSAHRWLACPPSARLEEAHGVPDKGSPYAAEGTAAHEYAEVELLHRLGEINNRSHSGRMRKIRSSEWFSAEMEAAVTSYANEVMAVVDGFRAEGLEPYAYLEQRVDYSDYVPEGFGTADAVVLADGVLHVIDLKYGKGVPVSAQGNPQLRLYALGAALKYRTLFDFDTVRMSIVQPRLESTSTDETSLEELLFWAETTVRPAAELAFEGKGAFAPSETACRWCRAKAVCRARADEALAEAAEEFSAATPPTVEELRAALEERKPEWLEEDEVAALLPILPRIEAWCKDVRDWALEQARDKGVRFPGYKLVEGRSVREVVDQAGAMEALEAQGCTPEAYLKPREVKPIGQLEKLLGKDGFEQILGPFVDKPAGKPVLVPEDDKRPEIGSAEAAKADFMEAA